MRSRRTSIAAAIWGLWYAIYRSYYAFGGTAFLPGVIASPTAFRHINAIGSGILLLLALLPLIMLPLWRSDAWRRWLLVLCWIIAVGASAHALIDITQRILSLTGHLHIQYPAAIWHSVNYREADLQDLFFNEPWFLAEGLLFAYLGWQNIPSTVRRKQWVATLCIATGVAFLVGMLAAVGVIGRVVVG